MKDRISVLHVDDEPDLADLAATFLEREDNRLRIHTATSAKEGLDFLAENTVDCIISDYDMPIQNGIDFLEAVREDHPNVPFILFTGKGGVEIASDAISAGVSDYLQKESGSDQYVILANRIKNLVSRGRAQAKLETRIQQQQNAATRREYHREILLELATDDAVANGEFDTAVQRITETAADVLDVSRVNIWLADDDDGQKTLTCVDHHDRRTGEHTDDSEVAIEEYPAYFEALETHIAIDADDAREDPRTAELAEDYLDVNDVGALLDATLRSEGETIGVICHEHVGGTREWTDDEIDFASDIADIIHRALRNQERKVREIELKEATSKLNALVEAFPDPAFIIDIDGNYLKAFAGSESVSLLYQGPGTDEDEMHVRDVFDKEDAERVLTTIEEAIETGNIQTLTYNLELSAGSRWFEARVAPITERIDGKQAVVAVVRDITERIEEEQELERFKNAVDHAGHAVFVTDSDGTIEYVNPAFETTTGYSADEAVGRNPRILKSGEMSDSYYENMWETLLDGAVWEEGVINRRQDGELYYAQQTIAPILDENDDIEEFVAIQTDITERKQREQELARQNERLDQFASVVSHDLRNPLNVAQGRIELAREETDTEHLDSALDAVERIDDLIGDLLVLAKSGKDVSDMGIVELADLADACWDMVETADAEIRVDLESTLRADRSRLRQLLENLYRNAVEHGSEDVTVRIGSLPDGFYVEDDGSGIPHDEREEVWESGYTGTGDGTGFGLSIVKQIVEAHDWNEHITESSDGGARFEITEVEFAAE